MKILVVTGGNSSERTISLASAHMVSQALTARKHEVKLLDFKKGYAALGKLAPQFDVVFPVMHGKEGEDGELYQFLSSMKKSFVGSDPKGARIAFDKILFKKYCEENGIPTPAWKIVKTKNGILNFGLPCVLKATNGGSSREVAMIRSQKDILKPSVENILALACPSFVEKMVEGIEITVGILLGATLPVIEIVPPKNGWFDYKNKYSGRSRDIPFAPSVKKSVQRKVQSMALKIHNDLSLGSHSRVDVIISNDVPYFLEINTPGGVGMTANSLLPKAARAADISFNDMVEKMVKGRVLFA